MPNRLLLSAAGSGKTSFIVDEAVDMPGEQVLLVTYTEANEAEIRRRIVQARGVIPENISVQTWFSFLLQHGVRPFQSVLDDSLHEKRIGFYLNSGKSGQKFDANGNPILRQGRYPTYWGEKDFLKHYFTSDLKIYADKIAKFVDAANRASDCSVTQRLEAIFDHIFIDEVQDLAGYDLEVVRLLLESSTSVTMVGDPRQVTYLTHNPSKHKKYANGGIAQFINEKIAASIGCTIDEATLAASHRNNAGICAFANRLYPELPPSVSCDCGPCNPDEPHVGVFAVAPQHLGAYLKKYGPLQLRWNSQVDVAPDHAVKNMGEAKGSTVERVAIFPTEQMVNWLWDNAVNLPDITRAKLYVAITRAQASSAIVMDCPSGNPPDGVQLFTPHP